MSNIHSENGWHGLDDEPDYDENGREIGVGQAGQCRVCYGQAKSKFFAASFHRKGETLAKTYFAIHQDAH